MRTRQNMAAIVSAVALSCAFGCSKEKMKEVFDKGVQKVEQTVAKTTEMVNEKTDLGGHIALRLDQPVKTGRGCAALVSFPSGRPAVLQVSSCREPSDETFPSVFLRAEVSARTPAELAGKELTGRLYVQTEAEGPVWHSPDLAPVAMRITTAGETSLEGEVLRGTLVNTATGERVSVTGTFVGSL